MITKYKAGAYTITYFNRLGVKTKKRSKVYKNYRTAKIAGDKWLTKHPEKSYAFSMCVYNSKAIRKWDTQQVSSTSK